MTLLKKQKNLTEGSLIPQIILFALPLIATSILQLLFNTADTVVVGRWAGDQSLAAVGSCGSLINLFINFFMGLSVGAGICVAHDIGAGLENDVKKTVHTAVITALVAGVIVTTVGLSFARTILEWMQTDPAILDEAALYMRAYFCGMPACMLYNYCASILRSKGDTVRPLVFLSIAGVANVIFNLISVIILDWGAMGVGTATAISQWISCILIVIYMMRMDGPCRIELRQLRIDREKLMRILRIGLPAGLQSTLFSISNVLIQSTVNSFGYVVVAGNTASTNLEGYIYASQNALYQAAMTFVAQNAGARKYDRMKKTAICCLTMVTIVGLTLGSLMVLFKDALLGIYIVDNAAAIRAGGIKLTILGLSYFLCGWMEVGTGVMRGLGKSFLPMIVSLIGSCVFRIIWIYTVFAWIPVPPSITVEADAALFRMAILYLSYPISWLLTSSVHFLCVSFEMKKFKRSLAKRKV